MTTATFSKLTPFLLALSSLFGACRNSAESLSSTLDDHSHHHHPDAPSVHGMVVFGTEKILLSHLPMFHKPHDYQVIMEVKLEKNGADLKAFYLEDRAQSGAAYYTFVPKKFSMTHLILGHLSQIEGSLVRGHFERGGTTIATNVAAVIASMPVAEKFVRGAQKPEKASYYVLGDEKETFLAHKIVAKPLEFDQVIEAKLAHAFWENGKSGDLISTSLPNKPADRLKPDSEIDAVTTMGSTIKVEAGAEVYMETGDLDF